MYLHWIGLIILNHIKNTENINYIIKYGSDHQKFFDPCGPALCQTNYHANRAYEHGEFHKFVDLERAEHLGFH
jgi:hypothetical protein